MLRHGTVALAVAMLLACSGGDDDGAPRGPAPFPLGTTAHSHGDPSPLEQEALELLQRARRDPAAEGKWLVAEPSAQDAIAYYAIDTGALATEFESYPASQPLVFDERLLAAARKHATDMATNGFQGHTGSDGSSVSDRAQAAGYTGGVGENVFAHADSPVHAHAGFLIDWGVESLGHRKNALDLDGHGYRDIGVGVVHATHADVGPLAIVHDFGIPPVEINPDFDPLDPESSIYLVPDVFLVGVVHRDADGDGAYDAGEGVGGHRIVPDLGDTYAVSSSSGGYAIPFPSDFGAIQVQWQDPDGRVLRQIEIQVGAASQKLDFVIPAEPAAP
jgi:hypothetical protein